MKLAFSPADIGQAGGVTISSVIEMDGMGVQASLDISEPIDLAGAIEMDGFAINSVIEPIIPVGVGGAIEMDGIGISAILEPEGIPPAHTELTNVTLPYTQGVPADWAFLHQGPFSIYIVARTTSADPGLLQVILDTGARGASANTGITIAFDDRNAFNDQLFVIISRGTLGNPTVAITRQDGDLPSGSNQVVEIHYKFGDTNGPDFVARVNGIVVDAKNSTSTPAGTNPNAALHIGQDSDGNFPLNGAVEKVLIYTEKHEPSLRDQIQGQLSALYP